MFYGVKLPNQRNGTPFRSVNWISASGLFRPRQFKPFLQTWALTSSSTWRCTPASPWPTPSSPPCEPSSLPTVSSVPPPSSTEGSWTGSWRCVIRASCTSSNCHSLRAASKSRAEQIECLSCLAAVDEGQSTRRPTERLPGWNSTLADERMLIILKHL